MQHSTQYFLTEELPDRPEVPAGLVVDWNSYENGYTGYSAYWFSKDEIELSPLWKRVYENLPGVFTIVFPERFYTAIPR